MTISRSTSRARLSSSSPWTSSFCTIVENNLALVNAESQSSLTDFEMNGFRKANGEYRGFGRAALPAGLAMAIFLIVAPGSPLAAATVDRVAALIDKQVLTVSEVSQMVELHFFPRPAKQSDDDYRHDVLEGLIAQALRFRDVARL